MSHTERPLFPDTLSLEDRAAPAIHSLIGIINPDNGYLPLMYADLTAKPTFLEHSCWDYGCHVGRYTQGYANFHDQTRVLAALTVWYMLTGEQRIKTAADRLCAGMRCISN